MHESTMTQEIAEAACGCTSRPKQPIKKLAVMYCVMVAVSTVVICVFEHSTLFSAFRTALIAAVGKTIAANWVTSLFD